MKRLLIFIWVILVVFTGCRRKRSVDPTFAELIAREWRVSRALINGQVDNAGNYAGFRIRFTSADANGGNYTVIPGSAPARPNLSPNNTGTWELMTPNQRTGLTLDRGTVNEIGLTLLTASTSQLHIRWKLPRKVDKTEPEYTFELVPIQ